MISGPGPNHSARPRRGRFQFLKTKAIRANSGTRSSRNICRSRRRRRLRSPSADDFPGSVAANAPRVDRVIDVPLNVPRWHSTGIYAVPGEHLTITVDDADVSRGLAVIIGAHTDDVLGDAKWTRFPRISRRIEIVAKSTIVANAFGGTVLVDVPRNKALGGHRVATDGGYGWLGEDLSAVKEVAHIRIRGGVDAPMFELGKTTPQQWARMRKSPAPWGEIGSQRIIFHLPASALATLEDPTQLIEFWSKVVDMEAELAGWPEQPAPPERVVVDRQISAGFMHSGYPVMAHISVTKKFLDLDSLRNDGDWGLFHELGHNHEAHAATFGGDFVEVNVNLFSMYLMQTLVGREMTAHPSLKNVDQLMQARLEPNAAGGPWQNLSIYVKTIQAFGWPAIHETLATYATRDGAEGIKTRQDKIDQWVLRYSQHCHRNLAPYYSAFGLAPSKAIAEKLADLKPWFPDGFPADRVGNVDSAQGQSAGGKSGG